MAKMKKTILTITGPSGSGKDTMLDALRYLFGEDDTSLLRGPGRSLWNMALRPGKAKGMREIISHTTRAPREGEIDGVAYYFVNDEAFDELEKVESVEYNGNRYCISASEIENADIGVISAVIVDEEGAGHVAEYCKKNGISHVSVFLRCSPEISGKRMAARGDDPEIIRKRLESAEKSGEYKPKRKYDLTLRADDPTRFASNAVAIANACLNALTGYTKIKKAK